MECEEDVRCLSAADTMCSSSLSSESLGLAVGGGCGSASGEADVHAASGLFAASGGCGIPLGVVPCCPPAAPPACCAAPRALSRLLSFPSSCSLGDEEAACCGEGGLCASPAPTPLLRFEALAVQQLQTLAEQEASGRYRVAADYMTTVYGGAMVPRWRQQLVEWMGEVVREFHLSDATYFAAVQLLDRLLSAKRIKSEELQAFALVACIVCAKVHDSKFIRMSHVERYFRDIAQVTDVVVMEVAVSVALAWDLVGCTPFDFLSQLCGLVPPEAAQGLFGIPDAHTLGRVLLKESVGLARLAASDYALLQYAPSEVGTACFMLAAKAVCGAQWAVAYMQALGVLPPPCPSLVAALGALVPGAPVDPRGSPASVTQV